MTTDNLVPLNSDSSNGLRHGTFDSGRSRRIDSSTGWRPWCRTPRDATVHLLPEVGHLLPDPSATLLDFLRDLHEAGSEG